MDKDLLIVSLQTQVKQLQTERNYLQSQCNTDALTNIPNRRHFATVLDSEIKQSIRNNRPVALIAFDIDNFGLVNKTLGDAEGDRVLCLIATAVVNSVRKSDLVARYGGEEFVALLPESDADSAKIVAERMRSHLASTGYTASFGVASIVPRSVEDKDLLVLRSFQSMRVAKKIGKNCVHCLIG